MAMRLSRCTVSNIWEIVLYSANSREPRENDITENTQMSSFAILKFFKIVAFKPQTVSLMPL